MVAAWAEVAGGKVDDGVLLLPAVTPKGSGAATATLKIYARCVGLTVGEPLCVLNVRHFSLPTNGTIGLSRLRAAPKWLWAILGARYLTDGWSTAEAEKQAQRF